MGCIIGVFSAKGGVGKSLLVTNLGVALAAGHKRRVVVIDLNPGMGTADLLLDLEPERSWADLLPVMDELTSQHIHLAATEYRPGLDFLACPPKFMGDRILDQEGIEALLAAFWEEYELVLLDTPSGGGEMNRAAYVLSDVRLIVLTPDAPALRATGRYLKSIPEGEGVTALVINQHSPGAAIKPEEIADHLQKQLYAVLPMDPSGVWANVSYGQPCVLRKNSRLGKSIRQLSTKVLRDVDQLSAKKYV